MYRTLCALLIFLTTFSAFAAADLERVDVSDLRPTQFTVGMKYVYGKSKMLKGLSKKERRLYLRQHPIPAVLGSDGELYMIDHHHLARAVLEAGFHRVYVTVIYDWSKSGLTKEAFWDRMRSMGLVYLRDEHGRNRSVDSLPRQVSRLVNDSYRALAGEVRDRGGYRKTTTPFTEFTWASYFRLHISRDFIEDHWNNSIMIGLELAKDPDASSLPGYNHLTCENLFVR